MSKEDVIRKRVERWKRGAPGEVELGEVWEVACFYFPESEYKQGKRGSHLHRVKWSDQAIVARAYGLVNISPFESDNTFLIATKSGRKVRKEYIEKLLKAIEWKELYDEVRSKKG